MIAPARLLPQPYPDMTHRMTIRVSKGSLAFAIANPQASAQLDFMPYTAKSGVSMAANLREAFKTTDLLRYDTRRAQVLIDAPVLLIPIEEYQEDNLEVLYKHSYPDTEGAVVMANILPDLNAVALFAVNKDLKLVVEDHYDDVKFITVMRPVWGYLHHRSFIGNRRKLFAHFHDNVLEVFSFERNRFIFSNRFEVKSTKDAAYFMLFVWQQLVLDQKKDELYLTGNIPDKELLTNELKAYVEKVTIINPAADFNRAPMTAIKGITFDLLTLYLT